MKFIGHLALLIILLGACEQKPKTQVDIALPFYHDPSFTPIWMDEADASLDTIHTIPSFRFIDQMGDTITEATIDGKVYVANFFFTYCPSVCPRMASNLSLVQDAFLKDDRVKILSHSVMPWADSVSRLNDYADQYEIDHTKWHLLTGEQSDLYGMGRLAYFADEGFGKGLTDMDDFLHTENMVLVDQKRRIRGVYNGTLPMDTKRMISDIHSLLEQ